MLKQFLDNNGLSYLVTKIKQFIEGKGYQTDIQVGDSIQRYVSNGGYLTRKIVPSVPLPSDANENIIYQVWESDGYISYMKIGSKVVRVGNESVGGYVDEITILPGQWDVGGVFKYSNRFITSTPRESTQIWSIPEYPQVGTNANLDAMKKAIFEANIVDAGQMNGKAYLRCLGKVPTISIKVKVVIL